ncbi:MAG: MoxR family ATPase [Eubacteriales bacterium]|nr:MoxR family ATPase [Eubacteriales bacterium]
MDIEEIRKLGERFRDNIQRVIVGKSSVIDLMYTALICSGHILIEDVPGMGKTMMAKSMAISAGCVFKRIQFTPDLLPSDLTGINYYNQKLAEFQLRKGPVFCNILLADEINRATPRTQSSLLECMEENQVTIDGITYPLEQPFMVIATQNPIEIQGTFPLPEAQLDRFLLRIRMDYPDREEGLEILRRFRSRNPVTEIGKTAEPEEILQARQAYTKVHISDDIPAYIMDIADRTREHEEVLLGISPRGTQALLKAVQVHAIMQGRDFVTPDDVKYMASPVLAHRIVLKNVSRIKRGQAEKIITDIIKNTPVPAENISRI